MCALSIACQVASSASFTSLRQTAIATLGIMVVDDDLHYHIAIALHALVSRVTENAHSAIASVRVSACVRVLPSSAVNYLIKRLSLIHRLWHTSV